MVLGKLPVPGHPIIRIIVGQGPTALAVGAGGGCLDIFSHVYHFSFLTPSLWETVRYRLKYCLKGPLSPNQQTNQRSSHCHTTMMLYQYWSINVDAGAMTKGKQICRLKGHNSALMIWIKVPFHSCTGPVHV